MATARREEDNEFALWCIGVALLGAGLAYVLAAWPVLVWTHTLPRPVEGVAAGIRVFSHLGDPRQAYEPSVAARLPGPAGWWMTIAVPVVVLLVGAMYLAVEVDRWRARRRLGVRRYDPRGRVRLRSFARPGDVAGLRYRHGTDSWSLLRLDRREIGTGPESHVLAIGAPRSGKSVGLAVPWILQSPGAVVTTSTKRELVQLCGPGRARVGPCWVYAPLTPTRALPITPARWSPLADCRDWDAAQLVAHWLADATPSSAGGGGEDSTAARFWNAEASKLLGPLLHAAALDPERYAMASVVEWIDAGAPGLARAAEVLEENQGHAAAIARVQGLADQDPRTISYTTISAGQLVAAYRLEAIEASERRGPRLDVADLLANHGTLFLLAPESRQGLVAPLFAALLGEVFRQVEEHNLIAGPVDPPVRFVLDEAAHLAALSSLPERLSLTSGQGARIASLWQSYAQIRNRYREGADTVVASSHARVVLGPVADEATRRLIVDLLDDEPGERRSRQASVFGVGARSTTIQETRERKASAQALQQLERWRGVAITGSELPMVGRVRPWWERRDVARAVGPVRRTRTTRDGATKRARSA
jgi:type IV secretion system protein VirD4